MKRVFKRGDTVIINRVEWKVTHKYNPTPKRHPWTKYRLVMVKHPAMFQVVSEQYVNEQGEF